MQRKSPQSRGLLSPPKVDARAVNAAFELKSGIARHAVFLRYTILWLSLTAFLLFELFLLRGTIADFWLWLLFGVEEWSSAVRAMETVLLSGCAANALYCLVVCLRTRLLIARESLHSLDVQQKRLLGLDDADLALTAGRSSVSEKIPLPSAEAPRRESFSLQWLSALRFGSGGASVPDHSPPGAAGGHTDIDTSFQKSGVSSPAFPGSPFYSAGSPGSLSGTSPSYSVPGNEGAVPLAALVGSRHSSHRRSSQSIQTNKQLDSFLSESSFLDASTMSSPPAFGSPFQFGSSPNSSYGPLYRSATGDYRGIFSIFEGSSPVYELGTPSTDEEVAKGATGDDGVVSMVFGSRMKVTPSRISLSPIPLNLVNAELSASGDVVNNKSPASGAGDVPRNGDAEDSTSFRIAYNLSRESPKKPSGASSPSLRRSSSAERRRSSSLSPRPKGTRLSSPFTFRGSSSPEEAIVTGTKTAFATQVPITSSEILSKYKMDVAHFAIAERKFRIWICEKIVRPIVASINKMNEIFAKEHPQSHLKIGQSSLETLQLALSSKADLLASPLPYLLAYVRVHDKQAYLVRRANALSVDVCMTAYNWQAGGDEPLAKHTDGSRSYTPQEAPWGEQLPTDAHLIWSWLCVYLDFVMPANPQVSNIHAPFSSVYFLKKPDRPSALQCAKDAFFIHQLSANPPYFELVVNGGRERFEVGRGPRNLWRTVLLFLQHARLFNDGRISGVALDENGLDIARVLC